MKKRAITILCILSAVLLAACGGVPAPEADETAASPAAPTEAPTVAPTEAVAAPSTGTDLPEGVTDPAAPYFIASFEDGTLAPDRIEGKAGKDNAIRLYFAMENADGMIGWNLDFENAGIYREMNFEHLDDRGLLLIIWSEQATECTSTIFINGSDDWENPDVLYEKAFTFVFTA